MQTRQKQQTRRRLRRLGFTLLEVLLVLAILGVIAAMVVPNLLSTQEGAYKDMAKTNIKSLESIIEQYALQHDGTFPESMEDLMSPVDRNGDPMPPYFTEIPRDPWGTPLNYRPEQDESLGRQVARIWSSGPNRQDDNGSGDDINNWDENQKQ